MGGITFEQVTKSYAGSSRPAVNNVSLDVQQGELVVLLGSSGCGKTTLLKMVNRLYEKSSGKIRVGGKNTDEIPVNELRRQIGYVIQQSGLFPHMTVEQNIAVVPEMLGWKKTDVHRRINELLELVHLEPAVYRKRYPSQMSGGQQQRVGLARALAADPPFLLMDEPFGAIDAITRTRLQDEIITIQRNLRKTVMFVTHDVDEAVRLADKIIIMKDGEVVQYDTPLAIITHPKNDFVRDLIGGEDLIRQLSLMNVTAIMVNEPFNENHTNNPVISSEENIKTALALLLRTRSKCLNVVNKHDAVIGQITMQHIRDIFQ